MKPAGLCVIAVAAMTLFCGAGIARDGKVKEGKAEPLTGAFAPEQVLANLEKAVAERDWRRYGDFLAGDFRFRPFDAVLDEHPPVDWKKWGRSREIAFIKELVNPNQGAALDLRGRVLQKGRETEGRSEWDLVYDLVYGGRHFRSRAVFVFERVDGLWYLREWIDTTVETDGESGSPFSTSGSLRVILSR